uniref:Uncharacterized protein n=1 Tax=Bubo bubo TaxID=30461 RepID=A0A8C0FM46_BUBBB
MFVDMAMLVESQVRAGGDLDPSRLGVKDLHKAPSETPDPIDPSLPPEKQSLRDHGII